MGSTGETPSHLPVGMSGSSECHQHTHPILQLSLSPVPRPVPASRPEVLAQSHPLPALPKQHLSAFDSLLAARGGSAGSASRRRMQPEPRRLPGPLACWRSSGGELLAQLQATTARQQASAPLSIDPPWAGDLALHRNPMHLPAWLGVPWPWQLLAHSLPRVPSTEDRTTPCRTPSPT